MATRGRRSTRPARPVLTPARRQRDQPLVTIPLDVARSLVGLVVLVVGVVVLIALIAPEAPLLRLLADRLLPAFGIGAWLLPVVLFSAVLVIWSIKIGAPIEEPAATARTPNPSKAPWYFLGLQELLVYFDPWIAGVLLPGFVIVGLCAIPYLDTNPKGNGYYTFEGRPFAYSFFWSGFVLFWVSFVILGTFLRGPNWSFFGPFEYWDIHKLEPAVNVNLSTYFWVDLLKQPLPTRPLVREIPGIASLLFYFLVLPPLLGKTVLKGLVNQVGVVRFNVFFHFLLWFGLIPVKMLLRWTIHLKYIVGIPEWFFNV